MTTLATTQFFSTLHNKISQYMECPTCTLVQNQARKKLYMSDDPTTREKAGTMVLVCEPAGDAQQSSDMRNSGCIICSACTMAGKFRTQCSNDPRTNRQPCTACPKTVEMLTMRAASMGMKLPREVSARAKYPYSVIARPQMPGFEVVFGLGAKATAPLPAQLPTGGTYPGLAGFVSGIIW